MQPESKKELLRIACGVSLCTAVMWVVFAALHLVGWVVFDYRVLLGGIIGALALFFGMPEFPATDYFTAVAVGVMSGLTATGVNQIGKQLTKE